MDIYKKIKQFGFLDIATSAVQIGVAILSTGFSMYDQWNKGKNGIWSISTFAWPAVNLIIAMVVVMLNVYQIKSTCGLIKASKNDVRTDQLEHLRDIWMWRNLVTFVAAFAWFPGFGITAFWTHGWYIIIILAMFLLTTVSRGVATWGLHGIRIEGPMEMSTYPPDLMEQYLDMQEQRPRRQETPMREQSWT